MIDNDKNSENKIVVRMIKDDKIVGIRKVARMIKKWG